jgi:hypothetical protein
MKSLSSLVWGVPAAILLCASTGCVLKDGPATTAPRSAKVAVSAEPPAEQQVLSQLHDAVSSLDAAIKPGCKTARVYQDLAFGSQSNAASLEATVRRYHAQLQGSKDPAVRGAADAEKFRAEETIAACAVPPTDGYRGADARAIKDLIKKDFASKGRVLSVHLAADGWKRTTATCPGVGAQERAELFGWVVVAEADGRNGIWSTALTKDLQHGQTIAFAGLPIRQMSTRPMMDEGTKLAAAKPKVPAAGKAKAPTAK